MGDGCCRCWLVSATHLPGGGPFSFFAANFYHIGGEARRRASSEQLFARQNFPCPAMGLSYPDMSFVKLALPLTARPKKLMSTHDKGRQAGVVMAPLRSSSMFG